MERIELMMDVKCVVRASSSRTQHNFFPIVGVRHGRAGLFTLLDDSFTNQQSSSLLALHI